MTLAVRKRKEGIMGKKKQMRSEVKGNVKNSIGRIAFAAIGCAFTDRLDTDIDDQTVSVFFSDLIC